MIHPSSSSQKWEPGPSLWPQNSMPYCCLTQNVNYRWMVGLFLARFLISTSFFPYISMSSLWKDGRDFPKTVPPSESLIPFCMIIPLWKKLTWGCTASQSWQTQLPQDSGYRPSNCTHCAPVVCWNLWDLGIEIHRVSTLKSCGNTIQS